MNVFGASEAQLELLMENLPGMAYRALDLDEWPMEFVSNGCELITGYTKADFEILGLKFGQLVHAEDYEAVRESVKKAVHNNTAFELEYRLFTKDMQLRWVWERGKCVGPGTDGVKRLEGFITDITERKQGEIALEQSQAFSEAVLNSVIEAVITINHKCEIETANQAVENLFGYRPCELIGQHVRILMPDSHLDEYQRNIDSYMSNTEHKIEGFSAEASGKRKDRSVFPIRVSLSEVGCQSPGKFVGLVRDETFRIDAENEIRQQTEKLAHSDRLIILGEMAAGMAHEINQPLTAISLFAQTAMRLYGGKKQDQLPAILDKINHQALRAGAVIERMQTIAKAGERSRELIDCNEIVRDSAILMAAEIRHRNLKLEIDAGANLPAVYVDRIQIQQVVLNLLKNAMESMSVIARARGDSIKVQTQAGDNDDVKILIVDSGAGISDEIKDTILTPFSSTQGELKLGLPICQTIISEHGGQLNFYNTDDGGATFFFTLPAARQRNEK